MTAATNKRRSFVFTLGAMTAIAALTIDLSLPAIPAMVTALQTTLPSGQLIVGVFVIGMALGQIPAGLFSDRLGRLPVLYAGLSVFTISALAASATNDMQLMLAARFVQGFSAASAVVMSRAIVRDVSRGREAAKLMSLMAMIFTAAPIIAPSIGALLVAQWGWRAPFTLIGMGGILLLLCVRLTLHETHTPRADGHPVRQLANSFREFFSHRQSIWALLLQILPPAGLLSMVSVSAALTVEIYGYSLQEYGGIFALAGIAILLGSFVNRILVTRIGQIQLIGFSIAILTVASVQLAVIAWLDAAPFWWLWSSVCLFMFTVVMIFSNTTVVALDPLPSIAGVASSILGTLSNAVGAVGALLCAAIYDGSVRNSVIILAVSGLATTAVFLLKPLIAPGPLIHHPDELARD